MPRLLQINVDATNGSNGGVARAIGDLVSREGWESIIAYGRNCTPCDTSKIIKIGCKLDVYIHGVVSRFFDLHGKGSKIVTRRFIKRIDAIKPDIVHLHNIHGYFLNYQLLFEYLNNSNVPVVWTFHDCWPFTGHCAHFEKIGCKKWKSHCASCQLKSDYPRSLFLDNSFNNFFSKKKSFTSNKKLVITVVSKWLGDLVKESFFKDKHLEVIPNGVDTSVFKSVESKFAREKYKCSDNIVLLGVASTWTKDKGLYDYISLSKILPSKYKIILIGVTDKQKQLLPSNIVGINRTENLGELIELYSMCDISLNLSYQETFGLTTVEAMACGAPCIVYDKTASPELVSEGTGVVVPAGDINKIYDAIEYIINKGGRAHYSIACVERVNNYFVAQNNYLKYIELYKNILQSK